jgi:hypothetical protein
LLGVGLERFISVPPLHMGYGRNIVVEEARNEEVLVSPSG